MDLTKTVFIASMLLAFAGYAQADIVECIDDTGATTFTDVQCKTETDTVRASHPSGTPLVKASAATRNENFAGAKRPGATVNKPIAPRKMETDVATLRAARISMAAMDYASDFGHRQALARLQNYQ